MKMKKLLCLLLAAAMLSMTACQEREEVVTEEEEQIVVEEVIEEEEPEESYNVEAALASLTLENYPNATGLSIEKVKEYLSDKSPEFVEEIFNDTNYLNYILDESYWLSDEESEKSTEETQQPAQETQQTETQTQVQTTQPTQTTQPMESTQSGEAAVEYFDTKILDGLNNFGRATLTMKCLFETNDVKGAALFVNQLKEILSNKKIITLNEKQISENRRNLPYDYTGANVYYWGTITAGNFEPDIDFYDDYFEVDYYDEIIYVELDESAKQQVWNLIESFNEGEYDIRLNQ